MLNNPVFFYIASVGIILFALLSLFAKNVIYSLLWAILVFFFGAVIFFILGSEYNAIIQAAVYGLAVPVIIGVSIMFRGKPKKDESDTKKFILPYITIMSAGIFVLAFVYLIMMSLVMMPDTFNLMDTAHITAFDNISAFANGIFVDYVWAFELVSLLLLIVIAGISMLERRRGKRE